MDGHDALEWLLQNTDEYFWNGRECEFIRHMEEWRHERDFTPRQEEWLIDIYKKFHYAMHGLLPDDDEED